MYLQLISHFLSNVIPTTYTTHLIFYNFSLFQFYFLLSLFNIREFLFFNLNLADNKIFNFSFLFEIQFFIQNLLLIYQYFYLLSKKITI